MLKITMENIGGISKLGLNFEKGRNLIKAPNATGKSSFVKGIELLNMSKSEVGQKRYYLNLFTTSGKVQIEQDGKKVCERLLTVKGNKLAVSGDTFHPEGSKVNLFTLATPENDLINAITSGQRLEKLLTKYSDVKYYSFLISSIQGRLSNLKKDLRIYLMYENDVQNLKSELSKLYQELDEARIERETLPEMNLEEIQSYSELETRYHKLSKEVLTIKNRIDSAHDTIKLDEDRIQDTEEQIAVMEEEIKNFMQEHPQVDKEIALIVERIRENRRFLTEVKAQKSEIEKSIKEVRNWISLKRSMKDLTKCIVCGRPYTEKHAKAREDKLLVEDSHLSKRMRELEFEIDDEERRKEDLEGLIHKIKNDNEIKISKSKQELRRLQKEINEKKKEITELKTRYKKAESELKILEKSIDQGRAESIKLITALDGKIQRIQGKIEQTEKQISDKSQRIRQVEQIQTEHEFYSVFLPYLQRKEELVKLGVIQNFNDQIKKVYQKLSYQDFEEIRIDEKFNLIVKRKKKGRSIDQPIESLSDSERITIALIVMLAGREEYIPDYPLFVLDKVTLDYDPTRFEMILDYLTERDVPYIIVTLAQGLDEATGELQVEYLKT
ncbi:MAG: archaea-specific SMC-related protein [Candidatus Hodarchaeales archaeon]